jgi:hypothetical protein
MKPTFLAPFVVLAISMMAGCAPEQKKANYTVEQYLADRTLMNKTVEECSNNPGELDDDPDCINAIAAARQGAHRTLRDLYGQPRPASSTNSPTESSIQ